LKDLEQKINSDAFHRLIYKYPQAVKVMVEYYKHKGDPKSQGQSQRKLQNLYRFPGHHLEAGDMQVLEAYQQGD
jgi:hypothetical protein